MEAGNRFRSFSHGANAEIPSKPRSKNGSFHAIIMSQGDVELTLPKDLKEETGPSKSFIQRLRSPKTSVRKSRNHNQSVSESPSLDSNSIREENTSTDSYFINKENPSPRDEWGVSWSSSNVGNSQAFTEINNADEKRHQFQRKDFRKSTWAEAISKGSYSTYGIAALMTATSIIVHPIIILAGVVWVVGAFRALDKEYNLFNDGVFSQLFWSDQGSVTENENDKNLSPNTSVQEVPATETTEPLIPEEGDVAVLDLPLSTIIGMHFPSLESTILSNVTFSGLNAVEFFDVFFSDDAPFSMKDFQSSRGDIEINYDQWTSCIDLNTSSMHPAAKATHQLPHLNASRRQRRINFKTLTRSYFGPAYASAEKKMIVTKVSSDFIVVESETRLADIPFSDRFFVLERWVIDSSDENNNKNSFCEIKITVGVQVVMLKECTFEKQIRQKTIEGVTELLSSWTDIAKKALDITAQMKSGQRTVEPAETFTLPWSCFSLSLGDDTNDEAPGVGDSGEKIISEHEKNFEELESFLQSQESIELELDMHSRDGKRVKIIDDEGRNLIVC